MTMATSSSVSFSLSRMPVKKAILPLDAADAQDGFHQEVLYWQERIASS